MERFRGRPLPEVLARWEELGPGLGEAIDAFEVWPAVLDVATHEHDIRGALGRPGARGQPRSSGSGPTACCTWMRPPSPLRVVVEDETYDLGPEGPRPIVLRTGALRGAALADGAPQPGPAGRLDWTGDPAPVLDHLVVFGPSPATSPSSRAGPACIMVGPS